MKVYVLTTGSYSDYSVEGVFSSIEKCEEYKKKKTEQEIEVYLFNNQEETEDEKNDEIDYIKNYGNFNEPLEMELDDFNILSNRIGFLIDMNINTGELLSIEKYIDHSPLETFEKLFPNGEYRIILHADSPEQAIKIANEKRGQYLALKGIKNV